jgi:acyl carrier protein
MNKDVITNVFKESIISNSQLSLTIFGESPIPDNIEDIELALSSLDFVDLIVDIEERLGFEIANKCMMKSKVRIGELIKIIQSALDKESEQA